MKPTFRRPARALAGAALFALAVGGLLEVALRVAPGALIPLRWLERFEPGVRDAVARRIGRNAASETWVLPRDDGSPLLRLFKPHAEVVYDVGGSTGRSTHVMDELGFCNAAGDTASRGQIDLLALGDSFTACIFQAPEDTWPSRLGRRLGISVYDFGLGGTGPYEHLQILRHFGLAKRPRLVVMHLYEGNDLRDSVRVQAARAVTRGEAWTPLPDDVVERLDPRALLASPLGRRSLAWNAAVVGAARALEDVRFGWRSLAGTAPAPVDFRYDLVFPACTLAMNPQNTDQSEVRDARALRAGQISLDVFDEPLARFAALAREHAFVPVVSYAPSAHTVYAPFVRFAAPELAALLPWFSDAQRRHLAERARALGLVWIDLTPAFQDAARERLDRDLLYDADSLHCTGSGHVLTAERLADAIRPLLPPAEAINRD